MKTDISFIRESIESLSPRSAFDKASRSFALDLLDQLMSCAIGAIMRGKNAHRFVSIRR